MKQKKVLREVKVILEELKKGDKLKLDKPPKTEGKNTKLGGEPTWIQEKAVMTCPHCKEEMTFVGQVDSFSEEYMFGDMGLIYIFFCFTCSEAEAISQTY
jgi:uncharacterized protein YwqG